MLIKIENLPNRTCYAELSGSELEVFTRILGKMTPYDSAYIGGKYVYIEQNEISPPTLMIEAKLPVIVTREWYAAKEAEEQKQARTEQVKSILDYAEQGAWDKARDEAKKLCESLYYQGSYITWNERQEYWWEEQSVEHEVIDFMLPGKPTIRVEKDGTVTKFPV